MGTKGEIKGDNSRKASSDLLMQTLKKPRKKFKLNAKGNARYSQRSRKAGAVLELHTFLWTAIQTV